MDGSQGTLMRLTDTLRGRGDKPALIHFGAEGSVSRCSYEELGERVEALARGLVRVGSGERVGLMAVPSIETAITALAVIRAGAVLLPIDRQLDDSTLSHVLGDGSPALVVGGAEEAERLKGFGNRRGPKVVTLDELDRWRTAQGELPALAPDRQAVLFYTSGTTGPPKGVPLTHANIVCQFDAVGAARLVTEGDRVLLPLPLHHVYPLVIGLFVPLYLGLTVVFPYAVTGPELVRAVGEGGVSVMIGVPRLYGVLDEGIARRIRTQGGPVTLAGIAAVRISMFLRRRGIRAGGAMLAGVRRRVGPRLRVLASGGSAMDPGLFTRLEALGWRIGVGYGLTETSPLLTIAAPGRARPGSAGTVVKGVELRIDTGAAPRGMTGQGEIQARGPGVFAGYRNLPEDTAKAFTRDGWFRTGDLGYFGKGGHLYITGRLSSVIVTESGENIQPDEIESVYGHHPFIDEIGLLERNRRLAAVIVPNTKLIAERGKTVDEALRDAMEERGAKLPSYKRIADYVFSREALPRTRLGKIRRHLLVRQYERLEGREAIPKAHRRPMAAEEMSGTDRRLLGDATAAAVWETLKQRFADRRLTPDTSPQFDLGVDSLGWLELTLDIRDRAGVEIDEEAIGRIETVRDLLREAAGLAQAGPPRGADPFADPERSLEPHQRRWLKPRGPAERFLGRGVYLLNRAIMHSYFRTSVRAAENLFTVKQFILAPNHISYLDSFALAAAAPYRLLRGTAWAGGAEVAFANPVNRFVSRLAGAVPIRHGLSARTEMALAAAVIDRGMNLVWYPEGRRAPGEELLPFRPGIGLLLRHRPVPVVPAVITGTRKAMPIGRAIPRPASIRITFGKPRTPGQLIEAAGAARGRTEEQRIVAGLRVVLEELRSRG